LIPQLSLAGILAFLDVLPGCGLCTALTHFNSEGPIRHSLLLEVELALPLQFQVVGVVALVLCFELVLFFFLLAHLLAIFIIDGLIIQFLVLFFGILLLLVPLFLVVLVALFHFLLLFFTFRCHRGWSSWSCGGCVSFVVRG